jgi:hypothetical protein
VRLYPWSRAGVDLSLICIKQLDSTNQNCGSYPLNFARDIEHSLEIPHEI